MSRSTTTVGRWKSCDDCGQTWMLDYGFQGQETVPCYWCKALSKVKPKLVDLFGDVIIEEKPWKAEPSLLLCPNVPKPMHGLAPRVVLGQPWWNKERRAAYESTNFHCAACGVHQYDAKSRQWLEGHEWYDIDYRRGLMTYVRTVPLCNYCHNYIHDGRMKALLDAGKLHHSKYAAILQHGDRILREAGLSKAHRIDRDEAMKKMILNGEVADWSKWHLVIGRTRYKGLFDSLQEWIDYHAQKNKDEA